MNEILGKKVLAPNVTQFIVHAPQIAKKRRPGQFVMLRVCEAGERFPITIADADKSAGTVTLIVQSIGRSTREMECLEVGEHLLDLVGPLGQATEIHQYGKVVCVAGGVGVAEIFPVAQALKNAGNEVISIIGARNQELLILEAEMGQVSHRLIVTTDDGSYGLKGLVTIPLKEVLTQEKIDHVFCIGPTIMMKVVADLTRDFSVKTSVSLNSIMVDGTGMCGACRVTVGNKMKFACVDGPDFDAHQVDFVELMQRQKTYLKEEKISLDQFQCQCGRHARS